MVMNYEVNKKCLEVFLEHKGIKGMQRAYVKKYTARHGIKGGGDVFGLWDYILQDSWNNKLYFVQVCSRAERRKHTEKIVSDGDNLIRCASVEYYLVAYYRKGRGKLEIWIDRVQKRGREIEVEPEVSLCVGGGRRDGRKR